MNQPDITPEFMNHGSWINKTDKDVIFLCGKARSGKGFATDLISEIYKSKGLTVEVVSFADPMREIMRIMGWNGQKTPLVRKFMQQFGTDLCRNLIGQDIWVNLWFKTVAESDADVIICDDLRFDDEISRAELLSDHICIRTVGSECEFTDYSHASEAGISDEYVHVTINRRDDDPKAFRSDVFAAIFSFHFDIGLDYES